MYYLLVAHWVCIELASLFQLYQIVSRFLSPLILAKWIEELLLWKYKIITGYFSNRFTSKWISIIWWSSDMLKVKIGEDRSFSRLRSYPMVCTNMSILIAPSYWHYSCGISFQIKKCELTSPIPFKKHVIIRTTRHC